MVTPAQQLLGKSLAKGWTVVEKVPRSPTATGGCFSEGYIVVSPQGMRAYLKALDYYEALKSEDPAPVLQAMTEAYIFERDLLHKCKNSRLDRIIVALDDGSISIDPSNPAGIVQYIIFELADGDVRRQIASFQAFDLAWSLRSLHHIATGLYQLHRSGIAHQDLKPSNAVVFKSAGTKIADLGCASYEGNHGPNDDYEIPGDYSYAPPELLYKYVATDWGQRRFGCDLYLLGSMAVFFFTGVGMTSLLLGHLDESQHWQRWTGTFQDILPHLRDAFSRAMELFLACVPPDLKAEISANVRYLCEPDPDLRGHPLNRANPLGNRYSLERFVSTFNLVARKAELKIIRIS